MKRIARVAMLVCLSSAVVAFEIDETKITTPEQALAALQEGNARFVAGEPLQQDFKRQIEKTAAGQAPYATILSCLDSRVPPEIVFDQGIGDLFVGRVAGNVEDVHMLGSLEFAKQVVGTKLLVVLGHTSCGAVKGTCADVQLGSLTHLLADIRPALSRTQAAHSDAAACGAETIDAAAEENVRATIADIRERSEVIAELERQGKLQIVGAMYDVKTGVVRFL